MSLALAQMVMETMEMAMQMVRFTCIVFAHLIWTSYLMYSITFAIDETDLHVQSLDSGTTEGVGEIPLYPFSLQFQQILVCSLMPNPALAEFYHPPKGV